MGNWMILIVVGVLAIILGVIALINPFPASLAAVVIAGWSFLILGVAQVVSAFPAVGWANKIWALVLGIIAVLVGLNLLGEPLSGLLTLTLIVGLMFLASGIVKVIAGFGVERGDHKAAIILSGLVSILLSFMILSDFPYSAAPILGILLGIELISNGISLVMLAMAGRAITRRT